MVPEPVANIKDFLFPEKLAPLQVTSKPVQVKELFGRTSIKSRSQTVSVIVHVGIVVLAFTLGTNKSIQNAVRIRFRSSPPTTSRHTCPK